MILGIKRVGSNKTIFLNKFGFEILDLKIILPPIECPMPIILLLFISIMKNYLYNLSSLKVFYFIFLLIFVIYFFEMIFADLFFNYKFNFYNFKFRYLTYLKFLE